MNGFMMRQGCNIRAIGNLTRDPEQRETTQSGKTAPVKASIAVDTGDNTVYLNLIAWGDDGRRLMNAQKGDTVRIDGVEKAASYVKRGTEERVERKEVTCVWLDVKIREKRAEPSPYQSMPSTEVEEDMPF